MGSSGDARSRWSATGVVATVIGLVLAVLMVLPWPQNQARPMILGVMPASLFFWILWTTAFVLYVWWISVVWDPYRDVVRRYGPDAGELEQREDV